MSNPKEYSVGWICAISTEYTAAKAFLDETHPAPEPLSPADNNAYTVGMIGKHKVVIAVLPDGEYGISSAANVARDMLHSFPNIKIGLMVGIGGGAPSSKHDIRLGDIVVSASRDGQNGVFQYDFGKAIQNQSFQATGVLNQAPTSLRAALNALKSDYESEGHQLKEFINKILERKPRLQKKYKRPDPTSDRLYQSNFIHPLGDEASCVVVCGDKLSHLVPRQERQDDEDNPAVHYGLIASSNQLMKDALARDRLSAEQNVLCFEMEAAGIMNHFPCLVIRGICDYADSHKNKEWQGYAAMVAAAYAKDLLKWVSPNRVAAEESISGKLSEIDLHLKEISNDVNVIYLQQQSDENQKILDWISKTDFGPKQRDYFKRRQPGTGQWFLDSKDYQTWLNSEKQSLFCPGIPGAGKTIIASIVVNDLFDKYHNDTTVGIAYVYCNFQLKNEQKIEDLLASLLKQLAQRHISSMEFLKKLYSQNEAKQTYPSLDDIFEALHSTIIGCFSRVLIVVDALDELSQDSRGDLLSKLFYLLGAEKTNILITSRSIPEIFHYFEGRPSLEIRARGEDVESYIEGHLKQLPSFVHQKQQLQHEIKTKISKAVDGMFLLAQIYLNSLDDKTTQKEIRNELEKLQVHSQESDQGERNQVLFQAYDQAMERISQQRTGFVNLAKRTLSWVTYAKRPLTTLELRHAFAVEVGESDLDLDNLPDIELIVSVCAGLVTVNEESDDIRLVHFTTQEYFEWSGYTWFPHAHEDITATCVRYLSFNCFKSGFLPTQEEFQGRLRSNALYEYASQNWGTHARQALEQPEDLILRFLESQSNVSSSGQAVIARSIRSDKSSFYSRYSRQMTALHLTAYFGLESLTRILLKEGHDGNARNHYGKTPVTYAAAKGHTSLVELFSRAGVCMDPKDHDQKTPLSWAVIKGHKTVVQQLLGTGKVDPDHADKIGRTPLFFAVKHRREGIARCLLKKAVNPDATIRARYAELQDMNNRSVLSFAAESGLASIVELLLKTGMVDINSRSRSLRTPLFYAVERGQESVVKILLENGANPYLEASAKNCDGRMPLSVAAENGNENIVKLLLERGVHPDSKSAATNSSGYTPLWRAISRGHEAVVRMLLQRGADPASNRGGLLSLLRAAERGQEALVLMLLTKHGVDLVSRDRKRRTLLSYAAEKWSFEVMQFILHREEVEINVVDYIGRTPLSYAAEAGQEAVVELLLMRDERGVNFKDDYGRTPLSIAAKRGHESVVRLLLKMDGVDINSKDEHGRVPLSYAAQGRHESAVRLLLKAHGVDINSKGNNGRTPLSYAAETGQEVIVELLLKASEENADIKAYNGRTPLSYAAEAGQETVVRILLTMGGVEVNSKDNRGSTPLSYATRMRHKSVVQLLLKVHGVDLNSKDNNGRTPLSYAAEAGQEVSVEMLLEGLEENADIKAYNGRTRLPYAAEARQESMIRILLKMEDVDVNSRDNKGRTPLSYAVESGSAMAIEQLLDIDVINVNSKDDSGRTPLSRAAEMGLNNVAYQLLKNQEIDINSKDDSGRTPLSYAATCQLSWRDGPVGLLLDRLEVEVDGKDMNGRTPLSYAAECGSERMVLLLLDRDEVDVEGEDNNGRTPLSYAIERHYREIERLLWLRIG
ncbi:hypothetical protein N7540_004261, partial [Penicillium herquei]